MRKILTIVGTRPELIKMSLVIAKLDELTGHVLVHTGQNFDYELNKIFFDDLGIRKPDYFLGVAENTPAETIARIISGSDEVLERERPDAVLIYGDTNSGLAVIPAKRRKIPVFHMEAGNRCFDQRVPEELNRKIIDHLSDINIVLTEHARRYLIAEGLPGDRIFRVGSHLAEVLTRYGPKIEASRITNELNLEAGRFFMVSAHREENVDVPSRLLALLDSLNALAETYGFPLIVSTHPRTRLRLAEVSQERPSPLIRFLPPFGYTDYIKLQLQAYCVISDSGTITEEASLLDLPAITVRDAHERPEGMDSGTLVMSPLDRENLLEAVRVIRAGYQGPRRYAGVVPDYEAGEVSIKVVRIVMSYIDFVNRVVWSKTEMLRPEPAFEPSQPTRSKDTTEAIS
jgi:UDP-N-acetylglucosamine 2-epimerase